MFEVSEAIADIARTSSSLEKERLLRKYAEVEGFKSILHFIFNPYSHTGLKMKKLERCGSYDKVVTAESIMEYLLVNNTGTDVVAMMANTFVEQQETVEAEWLATGMVTNDLQIGVNVTTLNKVFGEDFIPKIGIMRGMLAPTNMKGYYIATEKIDGNRRLIFTHPDGVEIYTRSGKRDSGLFQIEEDAKKLPVGYVYDTECIAIGDFADSIELRQASASILNSKGKRHGACAMVFDMLPIAEYAAGRSKFGALGRKMMLAKTFGDQLSMDYLTYAFNMPSLLKFAEGYETVETTFIKVLPILGLIESHEMALALAQPIWDTGGEGLMLVEYQSAYEVNPNPRKTLLKIKATKEIKCECVNIHEGDNKYTGTLGAIEVAYKPSNGVTYFVKVGSGFADYMRDMYWNAPELIIGKMVEIDCFGESRNAQGGYSLNCPIFKRIVGEE